MIKVQDILDYSKPHKNMMDGARHTIIFDDNVELSIVGGAKGLYGDFKETFEVAVIDKKDRTFITKFFAPENNDDVIGYMNGDDVEKFVNKVFPKGFQVL
jgi:hypothetical protein